MQGLVIVEGLVKSEFVLECVVEVSRVISLGLDGSRGPPTSWDLLVRIVVRRKDVDLEAFEVPGEMEEGRSSNA